MPMVKLLNHGDYGDAKDVNFPVFVQGKALTEGEDVQFEIKGSELERVGFAMVDVSFDYYYYSSLRGQCELV